MQQIQNKQRRRRMNENVQDNGDNEVISTTIQALYIINHQSAS